MYKNKKLNVILKEALIAKLLKAEQDMAELEYKIDEFIHDPQRDKKASKRNIEIADTLNERYCAIQSEIDRLNAELERLEDNV